MYTLLLRLAAPMQSWGTESKFDTRHTRREPSKSGVIGLLACALGIRRDDVAALSELQKLSFGVRVDQEGQQLMDYHTVKSYKHPMDLVRNAASDKSYQTYRYYLSDAVFLAAVSSDDEALMYRLEAALHRPVFPLYLGRRGCPPTLPLSLGVQAIPLEEALRTEPWLASEAQKSRWQRMNPGQMPSLRLLMDDAGCGAARVRDVPLAFDSAWRRYSLRNVQEKQIALRLQETTHDAMAEVEACT